MLNLLDRGVDTIRQTCMHLYKHIGLGDPHLSCGAGFFFFLILRAVEVLKISMERGKNKREERRLSVAIKN